MMYPCMCILISLHTSILKKDYSLLAQNSLQSTPVRSYNKLKHGQALDEAGPAYSPSLPATTLSALSQLMLFPA